MDFTSFLTNNLPLALTLGVVIVLIVVLLVVVLRQNKVIKDIAESHGGAHDAIKALEQKQTMAL